MEVGQKKLPYEMVYMDPDEAGTKTYTVGFNLKARAPDIQRITQSGFVQDFVLENSTGHSQEGQRNLFPQLGWVAGQNGPDSAWGSCWSLGAIQGPAVPACLKEGLIHNLFF